MLKVDAQLRHAPVMPLDPFFPGLSLCKMGPSHGVLV